MVALLSTLGRLGQEVGRAGLDSLPGGPPRRAADLGPEELSALTGRTVTGCSPVGGTTGTTDRAVLRLAGRGVPASVFVKTSATDLGTRLFGGLARLGELEVGFYRDLRPAMDLEAPAVLGSRFDRRTGRFVIVLEDLDARGAEFVDTRSSLTPDQLAAGLSTLARLHGATTGLTGLPGYLTTNATDALLPLVAAVLGRLGRKVAERDPTLVATGGEPLLRSYRTWAPVLDQDAFCVLHGDPHPGNVYLLRDGGTERVGLLDWQAVRRGHGLRDAVYLLVLGLDPEVRRSAERDLLAHYRTELAGAGGPVLDEGTTWASYRQMVAYVYVSTTFTSGLGGLQGEDIADAGLRRAVAAFEDLGTARAFA